MTINGLIFDFDGLIIDTEIAEFQSWNQISKLFGIELPIDQWSAYIGTDGMFNVFEYLEKKLNKMIDRDQLTILRLEKEHVLINSQPVLPGVRELIIEAKQNKVGVALASSAPNQWVTSQLKRVGLINYFDGINTREDVKAVKPSPELYLNALNGLAISRSNAIAFEDSPTGIQAAKEAGIFCVAVPNQLTARLDTSQADVVLPTLNGINLSTLNNLFQKISNNN